jgi:dTDP-4-amino-4,6-dideoxygalactose transaminase
MKVPLLDLKAQYATIRDEVKKAVDDVLESQMFILGPKVEELEKNIAAYSGTRYAVGVSSGTDALLVALMAIDLRPGDEVITTPFTFFATAGVVVRMNARPVFVDIDPVTFNIDPAKVEAAVTRKTRAIIPIHLFGQCADMDPVLDIARRHNLTVIEDAAQSIGAEYKSRKVGAMGPLGIFSFFPSKNLGGIGEGGMVIMNDAALYDKVKKLRVHGMEPKYFHALVGGNFRLDAIQAAALNVKLKYLDGWSRKRQANARDYDCKFHEVGLVKKGLVTTPRAVYEGSGDKNYHIYNQYTLRVKDRDGLQGRLKEKTIGHDIYYPVPLHLQECFRDLGYRRGDFPESERAAIEVLSLPVYPELSAEQKDYVVRTIAEFYA